VRPFDVDVRWLNALVLAATGGGEGLADRPRFLLARHDETVLVGGACRAALLSDIMNSDGSRPLYSFVGWLSKDAGAAVPDLEAMESLWLPWATAVYESWMLVDWDKHPTDLADAHEPPFGGPPWPAESTVQQGPAAPVSERPWQPRRDGQAVVVAEEAQAVAWRQLCAGPGDFAFTVGPPTSFPDPNGVLTHLTIAGAGRPPADIEGARPAIDTPEPHTGPSPDADVRMPPPADGGQPEQARDGRPPAGDHMPPPHVPGEQAFASPGNHDRPPPGRQAAPGYPPPGRPVPRPESDDRRRAGTSFHDRHHEAGPIQDASYRPDDVSDARRRAQSGTGLFRRAGQALKSLVGPDPHAEYDAAPPEPRTSPVRPMTGPAGDLEYWQRAEAAQPPPSGGLHKPVPPDENDS
jgi:hypothetical protein